MQKFLVESEIADKISREVKKNENSKQHKRKLDFLLYLKYCRHFSLFLSKTTELSQTKLLQNILLNVNFRVEFEPLA